MTKRVVRPSSRQAGNILFLILLAVVLFAALSYAVTSSLRGGGKDVSDEQAKALASQIIGMMVNTSSGLERFLLTNDLTVEKIDIARSPWTMSGDTSSCTTSACNLFDPAGGNVSVPLIPPAAVSKKDISSCNYVASSGEIRPFPMLISVGNVGTDAPEVALYYCGLSEKVCEAINVAMGLKKAGDAGISLIAGTGGITYNGFTAGNNNPIAATTVGQIGISDARIKGAHIACGEREKLGTTGLGNILVAVIYPR